MEINIKQYQQQNKKIAPKQEKVKKKETSTSIFDFLNKDIQLFGNKLSLKKKESFYAELSVLLKAGLDLKTALDLVLETQEKEKDKALIETIRTALVQGENLSGAMEQTQKFSTYEIYSVRIAEESGKLPPILNELSVYFAKSMQFRRLLVSALSYPILVIFVSFLALAFLLNFLVPLFGDIYTRLDQELPAITLWIIHLSAIFQKYFSIGFMVIIGIIAFLFYQRKTIWFRKASSKVMLYIPVFGSLIRQLYISRFSQALSFLLSSKVPLLKATDLTRKMIGFYPLEHSLEVINQDILKGQPLHTSMRQFSIYPKQMIALIKVGEEANQLENMFAKIATQYTDEVEQKTKMLGSLIEPVLIVFLAMIVGLVLVSMYLPIFKLVTNFGI